MNVIISVRLREHQQTTCMRFVSQAKGDSKGQPDLELKWKLDNGYTYALATGLNNICKANG